LARKSKSRRLPAAAGPWMPSARRLRTARSGRGSSRSSLAANPLDSRVRRDVR